LLTIFGSIAVGIMFLSYLLERHSKWMVLVFALGSALTAAYSGLEEVYPITVIEGLWTLAALQRFIRRYRNESSSAG
jgi:hypothetical protein